MTTEENIIDLPLQTRADVCLEPDSINAEARTIEVLWSTGASVRRRDLFAAPAELQNLSLAIVGGQALLMWSLPEELDVQYGGWIMFRHSPDLAATLWPNTTSLAQAVIGEQTHVYMPLKPGTYFARTYDADGRPSNGFTRISTTQASLLTFSPVGSIIEDPLFTGGKANCTVTSGQLTLTLDIRGVDLTSAARLLPRQVTPSQIADPVQTELRSFSPKDIADIVAAVLAS